MFRRLKIFGQGSAMLLSKVHVSRRFGGRKTRLANSARLSLYYTIACPILSFNIIYALSALLGKVSNDFQNVLVIIIAKVRLIYFFTFFLAILGVLTHLKMCLLTTFLSLRPKFRTTPLCDQATVSVPQAVDRFVHGSRS